MINTLPRLSIWEIACRTNDFDPSAIDIKNIPLKVKDAIKSIARAIHFDENMIILNNRGIENYGATNQKTGKQYSSELIHDLLSDCYEKEKFDKEFLDAVYIEDEHFANWCINKKISLPSFWFPNGWNSYDQEEKKIVDENSKSESLTDITKLKESQIDKIVCQAIARTLWDIEPDMTIASMCKHQAIQIYGNGKQYTGLHTLRNWLSEVAPDNIKGKKGRPKKSEG